MPPDSDSNSPQMPRILIVDDDAGQRSLLDSFLKSQGFQTEPVSSGEEALAALRVEDFSMMISDVRMPGISGLETLRQARQQHAVLPILLVTAFPHRRRARRAAAEGRRPKLSEQAHRPRGVAGLSSSSDRPGRGRAVKIQREQAIARRRHRQKS